MHKYLRTFSSMLRYKYGGFSSQKSIPELKPSHTEYGNMLDAGRMGGYHQFLKEKHGELGPIFFFWILKDRVVSLGHPKYWSAVSHLQDRSAHIRMFLRPLFGTAKTINLANGPDRAERYRKYITPLMNKETVDAVYSLIFKNHSKLMFDKWNKMAKAGEKIPIQEHFSLFVLSNMMEILFGVKHVPEQELIKLFDYLTYCVVNVETKTLNVEMDAETEKQIKEKVNYIHEFIKNLIRTRIKENPVEKTCLVDYLKQEHDEEVIFTDAMTFFFGSIHTTVSHLTFSVFHLANNPSKQEKLQTELDKYIDLGADIGVEHMRNLKYLRACLNESLRLTPPVSTSARIDNENDITLPDGLVIPKKTPIILPLALVLGDKELWENPELFKPERFKEQGLQFANQFSPFGFAGGRVCAGKMLAQLESQMIVAKIFKNFKVTLSKGQGPMELYYLTGTTPKEEIYVDFTPRH